jgi:glycine oxidase
MAKNPDILIIGGGVIGLTAAYFLSREQVRVEVMDKSDFGQESSWAGAGILPPGNLAKAQTPAALLRAHSATLFVNLSKELQQQTGIDNGFRVCGGLEFSDKGDESIGEEWRTDGVTCQLVAGADLARLEPAISVKFDQAYFLPEMGQLRNPWHLKALLSACQQNGVSLRPGCAALGLERQGERITAIKTSAGSLAADQYLIAAGAWSEQLLQQAGWRPGIHPVRGQIALLDTGAPFISKVLVQGKRYLVPRADGRLLIGSTEEDVGFDKRTTAQAIADLLAFSIALVPGLAQAPVERCWAGLRPGSPDGLPFLGPVPGCNNLFVAAGHFRAGIQWSPATGLLLTQILLGREPSLPLEPFRLDRISAPPLQAAFQS